TRVREADTRLCLFLPIARPVVADAQHEYPLGRGCRDLDRPCLAALRDAVTDGVLDDRLEDELRDKGVAQRWVDRPTNLEPIREAHLLNRQRLLDEAKLLTQRHFLPLLALEHLPEHGA